VYIYLSMISRFLPTTIHLRIRDSKMNINTRTPKIDERIWDRHRPTIERLYKTKTLGEIVPYMKEHHNFFARYWKYCIANGQALTWISNSQYERQFKKWRVRKNLTDEEWRRVIRYINRKSISIDQVEVLFHGTIIPHRRIIQETTRRGPAVDLTSERHNCS